MALLAQLVDDVVVSKFDLQPGRLSIGRSKVRRRR